MSSRWDTPTLTRCKVGDLPTVHNITTTMTEVLYVSCFMLYNVYYKLLTLCYHASCSISLGALILTQLCKVGDLPSLHTTIFHCVVGVYTATIELFYVQYVYIILLQCFVLALDVYPALYQVQ